MNNIKWVFKSKYKKLLYHIECAESNKQRLHLDNGIILDFTNDNSEEWHRVYPGYSRLRHDDLPEIGKMVILTLLYPTGNYKMEIKKCSSRQLPQFCIAWRYTDIKPYKLD